MYAHVHVHVHALRRYVLFDWDTHFAAYMLSLDARELGYSVLIQATPRGL